MNIADLPGGAKMLSISDLLTATKCALEELGGLLDSVLRPRKCSSTSVELLKAVALLLSYLLTTILPLFISRAKPQEDFKFVITALDEILGQLVTLIFMPLTLSFGPLSQAYTANIFSIIHSADGGILCTFDIRSDLCCLVRQAMSDLDQLSSLASPIVVRGLSGIRGGMALEVVRQMETYARTAYNGITTDTAKTCTLRIRKLARKDTIWYLCNLLHILFTPPSVSSVVHITSATARGDDECVSAINCQNKLLEDGILTGLSNIIKRNHTCCCSTSPLHNRSTEMKDYRTGTGDMCGDNRNGKLSGKCHHKTAVDEVEHGMILAVAERVWLYLFGHGK
jgi:hypothetical protein